MTLFSTGEESLATKGTRGVQLATASSKASDMCRGDASALAQRYKREAVKGKSLDCLGCDCACAGMTMGLANRLGDGRTDN